MAVNPNEVMRLRIQLSEQAPIAVSFARHERRVASYDMHYPLELGFVLKGGMRRCYQDFEQDVEAGQLWLCGIWELHGFKVVEGPCEVAVLVVLPEMLARSRYPEHPHFNWMAPFALPPRLRPRSLPAGAALPGLLANAGEGLADGLSRLKLRIGLLEALLLLGQGLSLPPAALATARFDRLNKAANLVLASDKFVSVEEAARECGLSRNIFGKQFEEAMGISFPKFALRHRLSRAAELLSRTNDSVKEIAARLDFTDKSHLHRRFLEHYGRTPADYRKGLEPRTPDVLGDDM